MEISGWPDLAELEGMALPIQPCPSPVDAPKLYPHTDLGNAELLIDLFGRDLRYCPAWNSWLVWDVHRWIKDSKGIQAGRLANLAARERYRQAADIEDSELRKATVAWARKSESAMSRFNCLTQAMTLPGVLLDVAQLDQNPWLLNTSNGTLELKTGVLREARREDLLSKSTGIAYRPEARAPLWEQTLGQIFDQQAPLLQFLKRSLGYSLTGDTRERVFFMNHGEGKNGKSTLLETVLAVLGSDYAVSINPDVLMASKRDGDSPSPQLADLRGARFVLTSESRRGAHLDESVVKRLTGGSDTIVARRLNENPIRFQPTHKIWMATNHRPVIEESAPAIWDRICLLPYEVRFRDPDAELPVRLREEFEGILAWLVQGCLEWQRLGLQPPETVRVASQEYRRESDELASFLEQTTVHKKGLEVSLELLYQEYSRWSLTFGEKPKSGREFSKMLKERGFEQKRTKRCFVWLHLGLVSHDHAGDHVEITRSPEDHLKDHRKKPVTATFFEPGDLGDQLFSPRSYMKKPLYSDSAKIDHQDHPTPKTLMGSG